MTIEEEQKDGTEDLKNAPASTDSTSQASAGSGSDGESSKKGYVTEESYKGLQRAAERQKAKLETDLQQLRQRLEQQATELEEAKMAAAEKAKIEKTQAELNTSIQSLQAERDRLSRQLNQQKIVLAEYPELAPLAAYIPPAETDEAFKQNAADFQNSLKQFLKITTKSALEGAAPPINSGNGGSDSAELEKLWSDVYRLAGIHGQEQAYEEAYAKLQEALKH